MRLISAVSCGVVLLSSLVYSNADVGGELRLRFESYDNMNEKYYGSNPKLGESKDSYLMTRLRVGAKYKIDDHWSTKVSMQDARVLGWGFENSDWYNKEFGQEHNTQVDEFELYQTYLQYKSEGTTVTVGRQNITYGDKRVYGPGEWKNSGKWVWDVVKVSYKDDQDFLDVFYGGTMLHDANKFSLNHRHGYWGGGLYGHHVLRKTGAIEPILAYKENKHANENYDALKSCYIGARVYDTDFNNFFYDLLYVKSFGDYTNVDLSQSDIDGVGYHIETGYSIKPIKTKVGMGYTYASGDNPNTKANETFDSVFGASDLYYGRLNLMQWNNLKDQEVFAVYKPNTDTKIKAEYHKFYADEQSNKWLSYKIASMQNDHYGDEFDIIGTYNYNKDIIYLLGAGYFMSGDYIKEASTKNANITDNNAIGIFAQINYKF